MGLVGALSTREIIFKSHANPKVVVIGAGAIWSGGHGCPFELQAYLRFVLKRVIELEEGYLQILIIFGVPYDIVKCPLGFAMANMVHLRAYGLSADALNFDVYKPASKNGMQAYRIFSHGKDVTGTKEGAGILD